MPDIDCIREQLSLYPGSKLGFVIYRLTYSDDAQWARFMSHLNTRVRLGLEEDGDGDVFGHIDWTVQEDTELDESLYETDDAIHEMLRRRHATYAIQHPEDVNFSVPRSLAFVAVTQDHVDWILDGPGPESYNSSESFLSLVALEPKDGTQAVTLSCLFPRAYALIDALGFSHIHRGDDQIFAE